jgi:hypothetical protein
MAKPKIEMNVNDLAELKGAKTESRPGFSRVGRSRAPEPAAQVKPDSPASEPEPQGEDAG